MLHSSRSKIVNLRKNRNRCFQELSMNVYECHAFHMLSICFPYAFHMLSICFPCHPCYPCFPPGRHRSSQFQCDSSDHSHHQPETRSAFATCYILLHLATSVSQFPSISFIGTKTTCGPNQVVSIITLLSHRSRPL